MLLCLHASFGFAAGAKGFEAFPLKESAQQGETKTTEGHFDIPLGPTKKESGGRIYIKDSHRVDASVLSRTYRMEDGVAAVEWVDQISRYFQAGGYELLFSCKAFECGRSSYWANQIFHDSSLYGPDKNQYLITARKLIKNESGQKHTYAVFYLTEKGNRRIYVHWLTAVSELADALNDFSAETLQLEGVGGFVIQGLQYDEATNEVSGDLASLTKLLAHLRNNKPGWNLALVGHDRSGFGSVEEQIKRSEKFALSIVKKLQAEDSAAVVKGFGVGPLAPRPDRFRANAADLWVELIVIP